MKKKTIFLLTFFVAILFAMFLMPNKVLAVPGEEVTVVNITGTEVKAGNTIPTKVKVEVDSENQLLNSPGYDYSVEWYESDTPITDFANLSGCPKRTSGTFTISKYYYPSVSIQLAPGYDFSSNCKYSYNTVQVRQGSALSMIYVKPTLDTININITEPTLNGSVETSTPVFTDIEFLDSSSNTITSGITLFNPLHWSYRTANGDVVWNYDPSAADTFNAKYVYRLYIDLTINSNLITVPYENEKYTGNIKINGKTPTIKIYNYDAGANNVQLVLLYDFRETKNVEFSYYPIIGTKLSENVLKLGDIDVPTNNYKVYKYDGQNWIQLSSADSFEANVKYKISVIRVNNSICKIPESEKTALSTPDYYNVNLYINNKKVTVETDESFLPEKLSFEYEIGTLKESFTVTYNTDGKGTAPSNETVTPGNKVTKPTDPTEKNFTFVGWYTNEACTTAYDFNKKVYEDITLYAKWTDDETYTVLEGNNQSFNKGQSTSYSFRVDGDYSKFLSFAVDGVVYTKDVDYTVTKGSTIITLTQSGIAKLNGLSEGAHNFKVEFSNSKSVTGTLTIAGAATSSAAIKDVTPKTGTLSLIGYIIGIIALAGTGSVLLNKKM